MAQSVRTFPCQAVSAIVGKRYRSCHSRFLSLQVRSSLLDQRKGASDPGNWVFSPEWWGTQGCGWGRNPGITVFERLSLKGNGLVSVTAHPASSSNDLFDQVIEEANEHYHQLETRMVKMQQEGLDIETTQNADYFGALIHHLSLVRNKRCLMSYVYNRSQNVQRLRWQLGAVLPADLQEKLNFSEKEFFKNYSDLLGTYMTNIDLDLTVDTTPPKDPYIQVRVMDDLGEVLLDDQSATLLRNSIHLMKRTEAESLISQGLLEEFNG